MGGDKSKYEDGQPETRNTWAQKIVGHQTEKNDIAEGTDVHQFFTADSVNKVKPKEGSKKVDQSDADGGDQGIFGRNPRHLKYTRGKVDDRIDARDLVEKGNGDGQ